MKASRTHTSRGWDKRRWDETDMELQTEDMSGSEEKPFEIRDDRVVAVPIQKRTVQKAGPGTMAISIELCFHGKPIKHPCATCQFEVHRLRGGR